jgi:hypothetical protein
MLSAGAEIEKYRDDYLNDKGEINEVMHKNICLCRATGYARDRHRGARAPARPCLRLHGAGGAASVALETAFAIENCVLIESSQCHSDALWGKGALYGRVRRISVYDDLQFVCVAFFCLAVPLLLAARVLQSSVPWWFIIAASAAIGWILANAGVYLQHRAVLESIRQEHICIDDAIHGNKDVAVVTGNETAIENPCGLDVWMEESYKPFSALLYGPLYLFCCLLPYWLIVGRRSSSGLTRQIALLAVAALTLEWTAIVGECIRPGYLGGMCTNADPYIGPPLTIAAAFLVSWVVTTQLLQRFGRGA